MAPKNRTGTRRIEMDPARLEKLAEARWKDHVKLREELKLDVPEEEVDALFHRINDEVSREVDCTQCANCCIQSTPVLDESDVDRLAVRLGITPEMVKQRYLKTDDGALVFVVKPCPFLQDKAGDARDVHATSPDLDDEQNEVAALSAVRP